MHAQCAAFLIVRHRLDHGAEDVGIDLGPIEIPHMDEVGAGDLAETRHLHAAGEQPAVHVGERIRPELGGGAFPLGDFRIHRPEDFRDHLVGVRGIPGAHLIDGGGKSPRAGEDIRILGEEAEDQPRHEVVQVMAAGGGAPLGIVFKQLDVELVQAAGGLDIKGVFAYLPHRGDPRQRQEETKMIREFRVIAGNRFAVRKVLRLELHAIGGEDELRLVLQRRRAFPKGCQGIRDRPRRAGGEVDVIPLEDTGGEIGLVGGAFALCLEAFDSCRLVPEGFEEVEREAGRIELCFREGGDCFFDFDGVHGRIGRMSEWACSVLAFPRHAGRKNNRGNSHEGSERRGTLGLLKPAVALRESAVLRAGNLGFHRGLSVAMKRG